MKLIKLLLILLLSIFLVECSSCSKPKYIKRRYVETSGTIDSIKGKYKFKAIYINNTKICNYTGNKCKGNYISICYYEDEYQNEFDKEI